MSKESLAYEEAKAEIVAEIVQELRQARARRAAQILFGGSPEQQEETYQQLMGYYSAPKEE